MTPIVDSLSSSCEIFKTLPDKEPRIDECRRALTSSNQSKNRYLNILPIDESRVLLEGDVYINASFLDLTCGEKMIACQGPLSNTIYDFWSMIIQYDIKVILMVTPLIENGKMKCVKYWPDVCMTDVVTKNDVTIQIKNVHSRNVFENLIVTELEIIKNSKVQKVTHLYYFGWKDMSDTDLEEFEYLIAITKSLLSPNQIFVCHCSAGVGRTGVIATIFRCCLSKESILDAILVLRKSRQGLVQNIEQYIMIREFLKRIGVLK